MSTSDPVVGLFGVTQYGVHVNGYTYQRGEGLHMWLGKRSATKPTFPGQLDQMVSYGRLTAEALSDSMLMKHNILKLIKC